MNFIQQYASIIGLLFAGVSLVFVFFTMSRTYSVPSPVFEPESVSAQGWQSWVSEPDVITGIKNHSVATRGIMIGEDSSVFRYGPTLILRCENNEFDIIIHWGGRFVADSLSWYFGREIPTTLRFDDALPVDTASAESADNEFTFLKKPNEFTDQLSNAERMAVRITNFDDDQKTAQFTITGLDEHWNDLPCVP